ncbi:MAG: hypothetical protein Q9P44_07150 [Anaerolineae bacterium]|nr:hypothetical protein [Anaerolineae bacterium]
MSKRKQASQNPFSYWWNEFLFARYFEYETDLSPEELEDSLQQLAHKRQGWIWGLEKTTKTTLHPNEKGLDFNVVSKRKRLFDPIGITTASTHGTAQVDSASGQTLVKGSVKLGRFIHILLLIYVTFFLAVYLPLLFSSLGAIGGTSALLGMTVPMLMMAFVFGGLWWRIYRDRNHLAELIEDVVYSEKAKRSAQRLSDSDNNDDEWQDEAYSSQKSHKDL